MPASANTSPNFWVRDIPVFGDLILSPMDGFSDLPFRSLVRTLGSVMSYTEFVNAMDVLNGHPHLDQRLRYSEEERPVVYQIFDDNPERIVAAALKLREREPDIIDVNMGCASRSVAGRGAGAGLLRTPHKIAEIFKRLTAELDIPVTGKIRLGWDDKNLNYLEVAKIIEQNGGQLIAVHGRTKGQNYTGNANWDAIAEIKQAVSVPVIANGDVRRVADIARIKAHTGCDGVMIGRAAIGNPWIFSRLDRLQVPAELVRATMLDHLESMLDFYGYEHGQVLFRKHVVGYVSPHRLSRIQRKRLFNTQSPDEFITLLDEIILESVAA
ncbi:MAG: tRNA dihydrouridine synthase DusB [Chloroflexi bacterium]|nr:tRNA dihydrouridine synthase DusB [Chloroflexota bacterium]